MQLATHITLDASGNLYPRMHAVVKWVSVMPTCPHVC